MTEEKKEDKPKKERKPLPGGFLDPLNTKKQWKPASAEEIFGKPSDVFGKPRPKKEPEKEEPEKEE